ncbi:MAG: ABC transporter permease [Deltaproteobacteria bacterium]|nr:ABC transporter permease [Deltaproteobacteria bacterium]
MSTGQLSVERNTDGTLQISLAGSWRIGLGMPSPNEVVSAVDAAPDATRVRFDASGVQDWDSALLTFLRHVLRACAERDLESDRSGLPEGVQRLLALAEAVPEKATGKGSQPASLLARIGKRALDTWAGIRETTAFVGGVTIAFGRLLTGRAKFPAADFFLVVQDCGPQALGIVSIVSVLVGVILAFMGAIQLKAFGAEIYVADLVALGMARDMGPIMVGIIMAGRTGAAFAAQLGTMMVNEEIDALETMGIRATEYLVLPRMLALMLMMPLLTVYGDLLGMLGGGLVGITSLDLGPIQYLDRSLEALAIPHVLTGLLKGTVYGVIVALAGCMRGMQCGRSAQAVGQATTSAVVSAIIGIIVSCGILTVIYDVLGV